MIKKIILTIIGLIIISTTLIIVNLNSSDDITVRIEFIKDDIKVEDVLFIEDGSNFYSVLNEKYEIVIQNGFIFKIDFLEAYDNTQAYIALYVNDTYSMYGITNLKLNDNDKVSFIYTLI